jgi:hypothetical protein
LDRDIEISLPDASTLQLSLLTDVLSLDRFVATRRNIKLFNKIIKIIKILRVDVFDKSELEAEAFSPLENQNQSEYQKNHLESQDTQKNQSKSQDPQKNQL